MMTPEQAFEAICGNCADIDIAEITPDDVRKQGEIFGASEDEILSAIGYLEDCQLEQKPDPHSRANY